MVELRFTAGRFRRWLASFARRGGLSITEARWRIEALAEANLCNDDRVGTRNLEQAELDGSRHQRDIGRCWRCHAFAVIFRLFFAGMHERMLAVGKRRERALYATLCRLERVLAGKPEEDEVRESEPKRKTPYANVGVYDPDAEEDDSGGEESMLTRRATFDEFLRFTNLPAVRRYAVTEHKEDRAVICALKNVRIVFGPRAKRKTVRRRKARKSPRVHLY